MKEDMDLTRTHGRLAGLVSVVLPTYNRASSLRRSIESCLNQTYPQVEVIVVDDGSTDITAQVVEEMVSQWGEDTIRYVWQRNQGACVARNRGLDLTRGEFIQFLDSDDILLPMKFAMQVSALQSSPWPVAVCDFANVIEEDGVLTMCETVLNSGDLHRKLARVGSLTNATPLFRGESIHSSLRWNPRLDRQQDVDFNFRYFLGIPGWAYTPGVWVWYVSHAEPRISDKYRQGILSVPLAASALSYWLCNLTRIPCRNYWMVCQYVWVLAKELLRIRSRIRQIIRDTRNITGKRILC